jgi:mannose-6-phosphate isomerase
MSILYPFLFQPVYKDYLWGGDRIIRKYDRDAGPGVYAESWEISDRPEGMSRIENGPLAGTTLEQLLLDHGPEILGPCGGTHRFPLLIKLIDSKQDLSLQVHPNDQTRDLTGGEAKTEMWYILDADPEARVYSGFKHPLSDQEFAAQVLSGDIEKNMNEIPVKPGDAIFTPGGRVHAIGEGCLILEVQQNSNTTYRIYDWGRTDADGHPRDLHLDQARQVIEWENDTSSITEPTLDSISGGSEIWTILSTAYFVMRRIDIHESWNLSHSGASFRVLFAPDEDLVIRTKEGDETLLKHGRSCLLPATLHEFNIRPTSGRGGVIEVFVPPAN